MSVIGKNGTRRGSLSSSRLARPQQLIHGLAAEVQEWLYYPEPQPLYVVLGTVAANMMRGVPVWMMLVGPPSSGRTCILDALKDVPKLHFADNVSGPASLLSGTGKKERAKTATGGLMNKIGLRGMIVMEDFTNVLSMDHKAMKETIGAFRRVFDGEWNREVGSDGGMTLSWGTKEQGGPGRVGFIGAVTPKIDEHHTSIQELGQRWLYYRFPRSDGIGESRAALKVRDREGMTRELQGLVADFFEAVGLGGWDGTTPRALESREADRLIAMAGLMVAIRSHVPRDRYTREITGRTEIEGSSRMAQSLGQLYLGLEAVGLSEEERWSVVGKVATDSAPVLKVAVVEELAAWELAGKAAAGMEADNIRERLRCGKGTMERLVGGSGMVGDLEVVGVVNRVKGESVVRLSGWARKLIAAGWRGERW